MFPGSIFIRGANEHNVAQSTREEVAPVPQSYTGQVLEDVLV